MFKDITLGQYYPTDSVIHRLDPRVKLLGTLVYIASLFIGKTFFTFIPIAAFLVMVIILSKVPVSFILRGIKPIIPLLIISAAFNLILTPGDSVIVKFWIITINWEGVFMAIFIILRLLFLVAGTSILTLTTTPTRITDGIEKGLRFLTPLKVPVHEIAMMMSIALRFIPILTEEADKIKKAQMARGADFESGNLMKRVKAMIPLLVPLFVSAFRRAGDLAMAMEARCYHGSEGRTKMKPLIYSRRDFVAYGVIFGYLGIVIVMRVFGL